MEMGKNNVFLSANPPTTGQVGCGAVAIAAAALFSCFYQGSLGFIKLTGVYKAHQGWYGGCPWHGQGVPRGPVWW